MTFIRHTFYYCLCGYTLIFFRIILLLPDHYPQKEINAANNQKGRSDVYITDIYIICLV